MAPFNCQILVARVGGHHHVAEAVGQFFQYDLHFVQQPLRPIFREVEFGHGIVVIEDVLHPKQLKGQCDQKNVVRRIAALNHMKSVPQIDPPCVAELAKQSAPIFPKVSQRAVAFFRHGMPVDADTADHFVSQL